MFSEFKFFFPDLLFAIAVKEKVITEVEWPQPKRLPLYLHQTMT